MLAGEGGPAAVVSLSRRQLAGGGAPVAAAGGVDGRFGMAFGCKTFAPAGGVLELTPAEAPPAAAVEELTPAKAPR